MFDFEEQLLMAQKALAEASVYLKASKEAYEASLQKATIDDEIDSSFDYVMSEEDMVELKEFEL